MKLLGKIALWRNSYPDFVETCSVAASLAKDCDFVKKEAWAIDNLEMPELPPHLKIMD